MIRTGKIIISNQSAPVLYDNRKDHLYLASINDFGFFLLSAALNGPIQAVLELNASSQMNIRVISATVNRFSEIVACKAETERQGMPVPV